MGQITIEDTEPAQLAREHWQQGNALILAGKLDAGIAECREAIRLNPKLAEAHYNLGNALELKGNRAAGIIELREAVRLVPRMALFRYDLGVSLYYAQQPDEAITELREAIRLNPDYAEAHFVLGMVYLFRKKRIDTAISEFWEAIHLDPTYAKAYFSLGTALQRQDHLNEALEKYLIAFGLAPHLPRLRRSIVITYLQIGQPGKAFRMLFKTQNDVCAQKKPAKKTVSSVPNFERFLNQSNYAWAYLVGAIVWICMGMTWWQDGSHSWWAIAAFFMAVVHAFLTVVALSKYLRHGLFKKQAAILVLAPEKLAYRHLDRGNTLIRAGKFKAGIAECRQAIRFNPNLAEAHHNLGRGLRMKGDHVAEIVELREAVRLNTEMALFHFDLGMSLYRSQQANEAIVELREAVRINPDYSEAYCALGLVFRFGKNDLEAAISNFWEAIQLNPKYARAYSGLGGTLQRQGHLDAGLEKYLIAYRLDPHVPWLRRIISRTYLQKGQFGLALRAMLGRGFE